MQRTALLVTLTCTGALTASVGGPEIFVVSTLSFPIGPEALALADLNGNGAPDLAVSGTVIRAIRGGARAAS